MSISQYDYHFYLTKASPFRNFSQFSRFEKELFKILRKSRYRLVPIFEYYEANLRKRLREFGLKSSQKYIEKTGWTLLCNENKRVLIHLRYFMESRDIDGCDIKIFTNTPQKADYIANLFLKLQGVRKIRPGSLKDRLLFGRIDKRLKTSSPNAKKIASRDYQRIIEKLYSDKLRKLVKKIAGAYSETPIPIEVINKMKVKKEVIEQLIKDPDLVRINYKSICKKCKFPTELMFDEYKEVVDTLKKAKCEYLRRIGECQLSQEKLPCSSMDKDGFCTAIIIDQDPYGETWDIAGETEE